MIIARTVEEVREAIRNAARPLGFVPTMGALHEGHVSLLRAARSHCDSVVMSIFVNPLQFGPSEDFERYPRSESEDLAVAENEKVDIAFIPPIDEMYPAGRATTVRVAGIGDAYEGASRPGHFDGVATVVAKLFAIVEPDVAFFGQKDAQQLAVIRRMVIDLSLPIEIVGCETVRETDGLAMSSRNVYLSSEDRKRAASLQQALREAGELIGQRGDVLEAVEAMRERLEENTDGVDYAAAVDPVTFDSPRDGGPYLLIVAARVGGTRLIDNLLVEAPR